MSRDIFLKNRSVGPWSNFESYLLRPENIHVGWVQWTSKQTFRLQKNPLCEAPKSPFIYTAYPEIADNLPENSLIRITDGKEYKHIEIQEKNIYGNFRNKYYVVEHFEPMNFNDLPKPYLFNPELNGFPSNHHERIKELLYRLTQSWKNAENYTLFQKEIAYNILSCQRDFYGAGGVGAETFILEGNKQKVKNLISSTKKLLPGEFKTQNNDFQFKFILNSNDLESVKKRRLTVNELSYNDLSKIDTKSTSDIQIQIPLITPADISYKRQEYFDPDVLDYHLHALLIKPVIIPQDAKKFTDLAVKTSQYIGKEYTEETLMVDSFSLLKIASSMCRLYLVNEIKEDMLSMVKEELFSMFKEFADTQKEFLTQGREDRWSTLSEETKLIYGELLKMSKINKESGLHWFGLKEINRKFNNFSLQNSLAELNEVGLIIARKNLTEISIVDYNRY